jgi:hypothetical protein
MRHIIFILVFLANIVSANSLIQDDHTTKTIVNTLEQNPWYQQGDRWLQDKVNALKTHS